MNLGAFSVSLAVKDIIRSKTFYENLGFEVFAGEVDQNWLIMRNDECVIGLFQGMFERNILTFNPGWNQDKQLLLEFEDIRNIQTRLKSKGIEPTTPVDTGSSGPASFIIVDPDGNPIMIDQHV